ncbi:hypothetical protein Hanom_Chr17g01549081 [Helianthus anomalus]
MMSFVTRIKAPCCVIGLLRARSSPIFLPPLNGAGGYGYANQSNLIGQNSTPAGLVLPARKKGASSSTLNNHISFLPQIDENENELQESSFGSMKRSRDAYLQKFRL